MNIWQFIDNSPLTAFFLALIFSGCITTSLYYITNTVFKIVNRFIRGKNIKHHGYPPEHCDADGDFKEEINQNV